MKKLFSAIVVLCALLGCGGTCFAATTLTVGREDSLPGGVIAIPIFISAGAAEQPCTLKLDILYDDTNLTPTQVEKGPSADTAEKSAYWSIPSAGTLQIIISSPHRRVIYQDGVVAGVSFSVGTHTRPGTYELTVANAVISDPYGTAIPSNTINGAISVVSRQSKEKSKNGEGDCFIATAAFGTPLAEEVGILRQFRDRCLLTNLPGREFVSWYYQEGPAAAGYIKQRPVTRAAVKTALYPLIFFSFLVITGILPCFLLALLASLILLFRLNTAGLGQNRRPAPRLYP